MSDPRNSKQTEPCLVKATEKKHRVVSDTILSAISSALKNKIEKK